MSLDKRLQLGGLQVGGPRTGQNPVRFRIADNVYQTPDGYMIPRFHSQVSQTILPAELCEIVCVAEYKTLPFVICKFTDAGGYKFFYNGVAVRNVSTDLEEPGPIDSSVFGVSSPYGIQCVEKLGCLFIHFPPYGIFKYDGSYVYRAGVPVPYFSSAQYASGGTTFMRVLMHKIDYQSNVIHSGYVQFPATPAANIVNIRHDKGATDIIGNTNVSPLTRTTKLGSSFDEYYFVGTGAGVINVPSRQVAIPYTDGFYNIGDYIMVSASALATSVTGLPSVAFGLALKIKSASGGNIILDLNTVRYVNGSNKWVTGDLSSTNTVFTAAVSGSNYWMTAWASTSSTGNYVFKAVWPCLYTSASSRTQAVDVTSATVPTTGYDKTCFNLGGNMGDFYDVTTEKDLFPSLAYLSGLSSIVDYPNSFSTYGDLALISVGNEVYFSDTTQGGSFEMINGLSFIAVGDGNDGNVQAVCGCPDFLVVSRKKNNYYVSGNLPTGNYRVQKISKTQLGSYSNETMLAVEDKILMVNKRGVWAIYSGARCEEVSFNIQGLFENYSETVDFAEESNWDIDALPNFVNVYDDASSVYTTNKWMRVRYDVNRGLVYILNPAGKILVLSMSNGEFYTWSGMTDGFGYTGAEIRDIVAIAGSYYVGINTSDYTARLMSELKTGASRYGYGSLRLATTWFTAGEPSLEKKLTRLKLFGVCTSTLSITHCLDWNTTSVVTDPNYAQTSTDLYSHKAEFVPANFLSVSALITVTPGNNIFQIEGMELEFQHLQELMKR